MQVPHGCPWQHGCASLRALTAHERKKRGTGLLASRPTGMRLKRAASGRCDLPSYDLTLSAELATRVLVLVLVGMEDAPSISRLPCSNTGTSDSSDLMCARSCVPRLFTSSTILFFFSDCAGNAPPVCRFMRMLRRDRLRCSLRHCRHDKSPCKRSRHWND